MLSPTTTVTKPIRNNERTGQDLTTVQDHALGLVELHEVFMSSALKAVQFPLDGIPFLQHVNSTTQLGVIGKLDEDASTSLFMSPIEMLNSTSPNTNP
ncbi:hypothetical protein BTVI_128710 [Pitangus sulphuratus]|nr:hypothetical protein BTVI_128710 [Pitangus sulphuratus]